MIGADAKAANASIVSLSLIAISFASEAE